MSYILEALRKAERERNLGQAPRMEDVAQAAAANTPPSQRNMLMWIAVAGLLVLLVIAALLSTLLLGGDPEPSPRAAAAVVTPVAPAPAVAKPIPPERTGPGQPRSADPLEAEALPVEDSESLATLDDLLPPEPAPPPMPAPTPRVPDPPIAALASPEALAPNRQGTRVQSLKLQSPADFGSATDLRQMPSTYRQQFPALSVDVHVYDPDPGRRFLLINGHRYNEGGTLADGPRIVEIVPGGMILDYRGERVYYALDY